MNRTILILLLVLPLQLLAINAPDAFWRIPSDLCPTLTPQQRKQIMLIASNNPADTITTVQGGKVWVESVSDDKTDMRVHIAEGVTFSIYVRGNTIWLIRDYCAPLCSSLVTMHNSMWLETETIAPPSEYILPLATFHNGEITWEEQYK